MEQKANIKFCVKLEKKIAEAYELMKKVKKKHRTIENMIKLKKLRALSRKINKQSSRNSWIDFTSSLKYNTPISEAWKKINAIQGRSMTTRIATLQKANGQITSDPIEVADELADNYAHNSSNKNYDKNFLILKLEYENYRDPRFLTNKSSALNALLLMTELLFAFKQSKNTSPGPDKIPDILLKNLPTNT